MTKTILIVTKDAESLGGVANYYRLFFSKYSSREILVERFDIGSRARDNYRRTRRPVGYIFEYLRDMYQLVKILRNRPEIQAVQVSPSLRPLALIRDAGVILLSKIMSRKTIVFFRGWRDDMADSIARSKILKFFFRLAYCQTDHFIVLADRFVPQVVKWGINSNLISVSRTMFDGELVKPKAKRTGKSPRFIYLSRIAASKGIFDLLEAAGMLHKIGYKFTIDIYGFGDVQENMPNALERFVEKIRELGLQNICIPHEFIKDSGKYSVLADADIFLLPTYQEGCPNAVIEALASGLYVISTTVGAIPELVEDGKHGLLHAPGDIEALVEKMAWSIENIEEVRLNADVNKEYAYDIFESKALISRMIFLYKKLLDKEKLSDCRST